MQVKDLKAQVAELHRKHDEQQGNAIESQAELETMLSARQSQVDLLSEEVDRLAGQVSAVEKEKEQINSQYLELWRKNYAQPSEAADAATVSKVVELETALESREGRLKQLSLQVEILEESLQKEREAGRATIRKASHFAHRKNWRFIGLRALRVYLRVEGIRRGSGCKQSADRLDVTTVCGSLDTPFQRHRWGSKIERRTGEPA